MRDRRGDYAGPHARRLFDTKDRLGDFVATSPSDGGHPMANAEDDG